MAGEDYELSCIEVCKLGGTVESNNVSKFKRMLAADDEKPASRFTTGTVMSQPQLSAKWKRIHPGVREATNSTSHKLCGLLIYDGHVDVRNWFFAVTPATAMPVSLNWASPGKRTLKEECTAESHQP